MRLTIRKNLKRTWLAALAVVGIGSTALAAPIEITNGSFESPDLSEGATWTNDLDAWTNPNDAGGSFIERIPGFHAKGAQHIGTQNGAFVYQNTGVAAEPNTTYTLIVGVGSRNDNFSPAGAMAVLGLTVLDGDATLAEADANAQVAADDVLMATAVVVATPTTLSSFEDRYLSFTTGADVPPGGITILLGDDASDGRSHFDNVRLFSQPAGTNIDPLTEFQEATYATNTITVDGDLSEWNAHPIVNARNRVGGDGLGALVPFEPFGGGTWDGPEDHSNTTYFTYDDDNIYVGVVVTDDYHENAANSAWNGDAIQLHVANAARDTNVALYNYFLGGVDGALADAAAVQDEKAAGEGGTSVAIVRDGTTTTYEICIPKAAAGLDDLSPGVQLGLGMTINDGDEAEPGQKGWGGIGTHSIVYNGKTPSETALVTLCPPFDQVWTVGMPGDGWPQDGTGGGAATVFVQEAGENDPPGDPASPVVNQESDDDYYFAGQYDTVQDGSDYTPLGTVAVNEEGAERAFAGIDNSLRYHFNFPSNIGAGTPLSVSWDANNLHADQADSRYGVEVYVNGVQVASETIIRGAQLGLINATPTFTLGDVNGAVGEGFDNYVELRGINYNEDGGGNWMGVDHVSLNAKPTGPPYDGFVSAADGIAGPPGLVGHYWSLEPKAVPTADNPMHRPDGPGANAGWVDNNVYNTDASGSFVSTLPVYDGDGRNDLTPITEFLVPDDASYSGDTSETAILGDGVLRFTGYIWVETPGEQTFSTNSDDGSVLYINNQLVAQHDNGHGKNGDDPLPEAQVGTVNFPEAGYYPVDLRYFNGDWTNDAGDHGGANLLTTGFDGVTLVQSADGSGTEGGDMVVCLDAAGLDEGAIASWDNTGSLGGSFVGNADATVETIAGAKGVTFDGSNWMVGPEPPDSLLGDSSRTIIAWVYNPELASEETVVGWGRRGGPDGTNVSFNHGFHNNFGAVGHWGGGGPDIGWDPTTMEEGDNPNDPGDAQAGVWTHISYTYDAADTTTRVYTNGQLSNMEAIAGLDTWKEDDQGGILPMLIANQNEPDGTQTEALSFEGSVAMVKVYSRALSQEELAGHFDSTSGAFIASNAAITWADVNPDTKAGDLIGGSSVTFTPMPIEGNGNAEGTFFTGDGGMTGNDDLDAVYNSHSWNAAGFSIVLDGLAAGTEYQIQLLGAGDTRGCCNTRTQTADDLNGNVSGEFLRGNSSVVGTFTATGPTQEIAIAGATDPGLSGYILADGAGVVSAVNIARPADGEDITVSTETVVVPVDEIANSFDFPDGTTDLGDGSTIFSQNVDAPAAVQGGALRLTTAETGGGGSSFVFPPGFDGSGGWTMTFDLTLEHSGGNGPADGLSVNYGAIPGPDNVGAPAEEGYGPDVRHISYQVDTWQWDNPGGSNGLPPGVYIQENGAYIAGTEAGNENANIQPNERVTATVCLAWDPERGATFVTNGFRTEANFTNIPTPNFVGDPSDGFSILARTGGHNETVEIDNILLIKGAIDKSGPDEIDPSLLKLHYEFEEGEGNTVTNLAALASAFPEPLFFDDFEDGGVAGAPGSSTPGGGFNFPADNSGCIETGINVESALANGYTMSAWMKPSDVSGQRVLFGQTSQGIHNGIRNASVLHQAHWGDDNDATTSVVVDEWFHATWVYDAENGTGQVYLNGVLDGESAKGTPNVIAADLILGNRDGCGGGDGYRGDVDDVAIWDHPFTADQVAMLAAGTSPVPAGGGGVTMGAITDASELDFSGNIVYAIAALSPGGAVIGDATFTNDDETAGLTRVTQNEILNWGTPINLGDGADNDALEGVLNSIRWSNAADEPTGVTYDLEVTPGNYKVTLLFGEKCCERGFDVSINGELVGDNFSPNAEQLAGGGLEVTGAFFTYEGPVNGSTLSINLDGTNTEFPDKNAIISGIVVEALGEIAEGVVADSIADWAGTEEQGVNGWTYGYRGFEFGGPVDYDPADFTAFDTANGWVWTGTAWDWGDGNVPWTAVEQEGGHPNTTIDAGTNTTGTDLHHAIRRWTSDIAGDVLITYHGREVNLGGGGVVVGVHINGVLLESTQVAGGDGEGFTSTVPATLAVGDVVDCFLSPTDVDGTEADGSDGSAWSMVIEAVGDGPPNGLITTTNANVWRIGNQTDNDTLSAGGPGYMYFDSANGADATYIDTGMTPADLGIEGTAYTMMARVRQDELGGGNNNDAMIFGQTSGEVLHNGARGDQLHIGHWGSDHTGGSVSLDVWKHVTFVFDGADHIIYVDGTEVTRSTTGDKTGLGIGNKSTDTVLIGITRPDQDRDFIGCLDDVRIYCAALDQKQIEAIACASPRADCDGDGIWDSVELAVFGTLDRDGTGDFDGDRLNDATEFAIGTAMDNRDSDGDGAWDSQEVWGFYSDPLTVDSDGDGLSDSDEIAIGTDPTTDDTDRDGITDGDELANGPSTTTLDFETDPGLELINFSEATPPEVRAEGGNPGGYLSLTDAENGARATIIFPDTTGGSNIAGFKFGVDARIGGGTERPADGLSVSLVRGDDPVLADPIGSTFAGTTDLGGTEESLPEEGTRTGVSVGFDAWESGGEDIVGFSVRVDGVLIEQIAAGTLNGELDDPTSLQTGPLGPDGVGDGSALGWARFEICLDVDGTLDVSWKGSKLVEDVQTSWTPSPGQLVFAARTGGANQAHHFDNLSLVTIPEGSADPLVFNEGAVAAGLKVHYDFSDLDGGAGGPLNIAFVSFHPADDAPSAGAAEAGFTEATDKGYTDALTAAGHTVTRWEARQDPTADDAAELNTYDLIIVSRAVSSNMYQQEAEFWNTTITVPLINLGGYTYRDSRLNWTDGGTMVDADGPITLTVDNADHPIFAGVDVAGPYANGLLDGQRGLSFNNNTVVGGTVLATAADTSVAGAPAIFEFETGATVNNGNVLGAPRLAFLTGSREADGVSSQTSGIWDLTDSGAAMFHNAVNYMGAQGGGEAPTNVVVNLAGGPHGTLVAPEGVTLRDVAETPLGEPTETYTEVVANNGIPTLNNRFDGADLLDATFQIIVDPDAKADGGAELLFESGGGTIGTSMVYEAPSTLVMRSVGNGGNAVVTASAPLSQADLDAGELELIFTHDSNPDGPETIAIWVNRQLRASESLEKSNDWSGGNGASFGGGTNSLAAGGGNTNLPGGSVDFASGTLVSGAFYRDTLFSSGILSLNGDATVYVDTNLTAPEAGLSGDHYTAFARVRLNDLAGDNMVLGQPGGNVLHNGFRDAQFYQGHWGNDLGGGTAEVGQWYDVAWRYTSQTQTIFVNGEVLTSVAPRGPLAELGNILVGATRLDQDRSFNGDIDNARIYCRSLSHETIRDIQGDSRSLAECLLVHYEFEHGISLTVENTGNAGAPDGALNSLDVISAYGSGSPSLGGPGHMVFDTTNGADATFIDTGLNPASAGIELQPYTMTAWVCQTAQGDGNNNDAMVFGQVGGEVLHNGARGAQPYLGHWGDDVGGGSINLDLWTHYAWTFDGSGAPGEIAVYQNGVKVASDTKNGLSKSPDNILVGTTRLDQNRDFIGKLDDVRIYNKVLSVSQIIDVAGLVDSDGDGLQDSFERAFFGNLAMGGGGDPDMDGITNADEQRLGLDPTVNDARFADADGDGWTLGDETDFETNPDNPNSFPEPFVGGGQWEVRIAQTDAAFADINDAVAVLNGESGNIIADDTTFHDFINFNNTEGGNAGAVGNDTIWPHNADISNFAVHVKGKLEVAVSGDYSLNVPSDDGMRILVDGNVIDEFAAPRGAPQVDETTLRLTAGQHDVEIFSYENGGGDNLEFSGAILTENSLNGLGGGSYVLVPAAPEDTGVPSGPPAGLLAYWKFDGEGDPVDLVNGTVATLTAGAAYGEGPGGAGDGAIDFGTTSDGQRLDVDPSILDPINDSDSLTVSFWQNLHAVANSSSFWADSAAPGDRAFHAHAPWGDGNSYFDTAGCCNADQRLSAAINATPGTWQHFAYVKDGPFKAFYVDGVEIISGDGFAPIPEGFIAFHIGSQSEGTNSVQGLIDEFSIWSIALNPGEIADLAAGGVPYDPDAGAAASPLADGLIGYWPFDGDLEDKSGDSHGSGVGDPIDFADGQFGQGIDLNGANHVITPVENEAMFDFSDGTGFSVSAWFRVDEFNKNWQALVTKGEGSNWRIHRQGDLNNFAPVAGANAEGGGVDIGRDGASADVNDGAIHHVVITNNNEVSRFYLDGVLQDEGPGGAPEGNEWPMMIGENAHNGGNGRTWNGLIDDVAVWGRGLSEEEVGLLYNGPSLGDQLAAGAGAGGDVIVYEQSFDAEDGATDLGDGSVFAGTAVINGGQLRLTENDVAGGHASFSIPAIPGSSNGWTATFDLTIFDGEGANDPADGVSLNYGNAALGELGSAEEGMAAVDSVTENLSFEIDTWRNGDAEQGVNIAEKVAGVDTNLAFNNGPILQDGTTVGGQVVITYDPANGASFSTEGLETNADFANVATSFVGDDAYTFIFSARVGGANESLWIDNLVITIPGSGDGGVEGLLGYWPDEYVSASDTALYLGDLPVIGLDDDFSWSFWVNADETDNNNVVFGNRWSHPGPDFDPREFIKFTPRAFEWHFNAGGENVGDQATTGIPVGVWSHNVAVKAGNTLTYYRDGVELATREITGSPANPQPLYLGGQLAEDGTVREGFAGTFMEVATFGRALSPADVTDVYNRGLNGESLAGSGGDPRAAAVAKSSGPLSSPTLVDFGPLDGDASFEFSFNAVKEGASTALAGNTAWALKLDQWNETGFIGTTEFGVADNTSEVPAVFGADTHVVFVSDTAAGETLIYVNGALGGTLAGNPALSGEVTVMGATRDAGPIDVFGAGSVMHGWATYNSALSADEVAALAGAPFGGGNGGPAPLNIAFVSFHETDAGSADALAAGTDDRPVTEATDIGYTNLLTANGHTVTRVLTSGDRTDADFLNGFDLIIISRAVSSGHYSDGANSEFWNTQITVPVMNLGGYTFRSSRLNWTGGTTMVDTDGPVSLTVADADHPIFAGVDLSGPYANFIEGERGVSFNMDDVVNGTVLATAADTPTAGGAAIFEFAAGAEAGNGNVISGPRLAFLTGSRELDRTSQTSAFYDLTASGEAMFLNAVNYMGAGAGTAAQTNSVKQLVDTDRDGTADVHERLAGTDANDPTDYFHISGIAHTEDGLMISFDGVEGHAYEIEFSEDLSEGSWQVVGSQNAEETAPVEFMDADRPAGQGFYRARLVQD